VYIHGVKNENKQVAVQGADPLAQMGVYKTNSGIFLAEWKNSQWVKYED
jgi:hypothetical protein